MKKIYMTPALNVVHVNTVSMMASSPVGGQVNNTEDVDEKYGFTKEQDDWNIWD